MQFAPAGHTTCLLPSNSHTLVGYHSTMAGMADVQPFRAFRPDLGRSGALSSVVCPPRGELRPDLLLGLKAHPVNAAHLLTDGAGAALRAWLRDDLLIQDSARSLYVVEEEIPVGEAVFTRRGFLARVRITAAPAENDWLPLIRETHLNAQPALALYPDDGGPAEALAKAVGRRPPLEADDPRGGKVRLWAVTDQHAISAVQGMLTPLPLNVVSGADMLAAAAAYRDERLALGEAGEDSSPLRFALMLLVGETEPGPDRGPLAGLVYHSLRGI